MGITIGTWNFDSAQNDLPVDEPSLVAAVAERLHVATGLSIETLHEGSVLRIPALREELFNIEIKGGAATLHGFMPPHPYLWENLDAVMTSAGGQRDSTHYLWQPNPAYARLRVPWNTLSSRDRFLLAMPPLLANRPFDRWLSRADD